MKINYLKKKVIVASLAMAMAFGSCFSTAAADVITEVPGESNGEVEITYDKTTTKDPVYSVTVDWTDTAMNYHVEGDEIWQPDSHEYKFADDVVKTWTDDVAKVDVTNHSNAGVTASIAADETNKLVYSYDKDSFELVTAEGTEYDAAPNDSFTITANDVPVTVEELTEKFTVTIDAEAPAPTVATVGHIELWADKTPYDNNPIDMNEPFDYSLDSENSAVYGTEWAYWNMRVYDNEGNIIPAEDLTVEVYDDPTPVWTEVEAADATTYPITMWSTYVGIKITYNDIAYDFSINVY